MPISPVKICLKRAWHTGVCQCAFAFLECQMSMHGEGVHNLGPKLFNTIVLEHLITITYSHNVFRPVSIVNTPQKKMFEIDGVRTTVLRNLEAVREERGQ